MAFNVPTDPMTVIGVLVASGIFMAIVTGIVEMLKRPPFNLNKDQAPAVSGLIGLVLGIIVAVVWGADLQTRTFVVLLCAGIGFGGSGVYAWFGANKSNPTA